MGISPCEFESRPGHQRVKELDVSNSFFVLVSKRMEALLRSPPEFTGSVVNSGGAKWKKVVSLRYGKAKRYNRRSIEVVVARGDIQLF